MFGLPLSWMLALFAVVALAGYIGLLKLKARHAEKRAAVATQERDNARVEQHITSMAQGVEHAFQDAHDAELNSSHGSGENHPDGESHSGASTHERLNKMFSIMLLCLLMVGCSWMPDQLVMSNPAEKVSIPATQRLEPVRFTQIEGTDHSCVDNENGRALVDNIQKLKARIAGLEAALRSLGAEVK